MTNIRDFEPGAREQRGAITVHRYPDAAGQAVEPYNDDGHWRFAVPLAASAEGAAAGEVWLRLNTTAVNGYQDNEKILAIVGAELLQMAVSSDPDATLPDGRKVAELKPEDLFTTP